MKKGYTDNALMRERVGWIFAFLDKLIVALPIPSSHRDLLQAHLRVSNELAEPWPHEMSSIQVPLSVHKAVTGDERSALPVAAACTLLYLGADLLDSMLDHELPRSWRARNSAEINLIAATFLAALPHFSISRLKEQRRSPAKLWALSHLFADTLLTMSAGQYDDLRFPSLDNVSLEDSRTMVERKSGSANALFAKAGAVLATEDPSTIEAYTAFGLCFGIAKQLASDVWDIWGGTESRDLLNGKRTLPIVHALSVLRGDQRERLHKLLAAARESAEHHDEVRALLAAAGSVRYTAFIIWLYQQRAQDQLAAASPQEPAGRELRMLINQTSLLPQTRAAKNSQS